MSIKIKSAISGSVAGIINGFFGAGGGMLMVPLLLHFIKLEPRQAFATSISVILPLCTVSAAVYIMRGNLDLSAAVPYLAGGIAGGFIGSRIFKKISVVWLRRALSALVILGGVRYLI